MITKQILKSFSNIIEGVKSVAVVSHKDPDGDAMGSALAMYHFLKKQYHVKVIMPNAYPDFMKWLPGEEQIIIYEKQTSKATEILNDIDLVFIMDCNDFDRLGNLGKCLKDISSKYIVIDHHQNAKNFQNLLIWDTEEISTTQIVYQLLKALEPNNPLSKDIATCLYTGLVTDSGSFRFNRTTSKTHRIAADLVDCGIDIQEIYGNVFDNNSADKLSLLGVALNNIRFFEEYGMAFITLTKKELRAHNFKKGDTEGFVNYALSIKGVNFAVIFTESLELPIIKISFRSKGEFSVSRFAEKHFEGGGHNNAAGGKSDRDLEDTVHYFISLLEQYKGELADA